MNDDIQGDLASALLGNDVEEEKKDDVEASTETVEEKKDDGDKSDGDGDGDAGTDDADGDKSADNAEGDDAEEPAPTTPLSKEDIRAIMREEAQSREETSSQRQSFAGQVRSELREALKLDSDYTQVKLEDGTVIESVSQLTRIVNPDTQEPYTREEAAQMLLQAQQTVQDNIRAVEQNIDHLTDLNVSFKEEADRVDHVYGDLLRAMPEVADQLLKAYQKTFTTDKNGEYVTNITVSPLEFYSAALAPYRRAADQLSEQRAAEEVQARKEAATQAAKAEQEDRGDIGSSAAGKENKKDALDDALDKYLSDL